jgi:hypothetical protein
MNICVLRKQAFRMAAILAGVVLVDAAGVLVLPHPVLWAATVPALIPLLTAVFVILPGLRAQKS